MKHAVSGGLLDLIQKLIQADANVKDFFPRKIT